MSQCGIYKYVWNDEVIYVGKSNTDIEKRIQCHSREDKFQKYLANSDVYYCFLPNEATTDIYELYYINKYRPVLNATSKYDDEPVGVTVADIEWSKYTPSKYWCSKQKKKPSAVIQYNNTKILWLQGMKTSCKSISESLSELKSVIDRSIDDICFFCNLLQKNDDYNQFEPYVDYKDKLLKIGKFINDHEYNEEIWNKHSDYFNYMIKGANKTIKELKEGDE